MVPLKIGIICIYKVMCVSSEYIKINKYGWSNFMRSLGLHNIVASTIYSIHAYYNIIIIIIAFMHAICIHVPRPICTVLSSSSL